MIQCQNLGSSALLNDEIQSHWLERKMVYFERILISYTHNMNDFLMVVDLLLG